MTDETKLELLPCPFCEFDSPKVEQDDHTISLFVWCGVCGAQGPTARTDGEAVAAWNKRKKEDPE